MQLRRSNIPRFSLRTLFVLVTCCALMFAVALSFHRRGLRQRRAFDEVYRLGGGAVFEPQVVPTHLTFCFRSVTQIGFGHPGIRDEQMAILKEFPQLRRLTVAYTPVTDHVIPYLEDLKDLESLDLRGTALSDAGIERLRVKLPECEIESHVTRRCRGCREFYQTRHIAPANLCPVCEQKPASATSQP